jgi:hypothetical protein
MAGRHRCVLWVVVTTYCSSNYAGLALGGISVYIKPVDRDRFSHIIFTHTPSVTFYYRTLGRELLWHPDILRSASDNTLGLEAQKA